ncbi:hypothetical protein [Pseudomonas sp. RT6P73]
MAARRPPRGNTSPDTRRPVSTGGGQTPRPDTSRPDAPRVDTPRVDVDPVTGAGRLDLSGTSRIPESIDTPAAGTSSIAASDRVSSSSSASSATSAIASAQHPLAAYRIPATVKLTEANADGLRTFRNRLYAEVSEVGIVQVGKDPETGLYRAKLPNELTANGPVLIRDPAGKLWRLQTEPESVTDPRHAYQRVIEGERPYAWDEQTLINRLGLQAQGLEDAGADILAVSRADINAVRRMYANHERIIPLLQDTVTRFRIDREMGRFIDNLRSDRAQDYLQADLLFQFKLLNEIWPDKAMSLLDANGKVLSTIEREGSSPVPLSRNQLVDGDLLKTVLSHLDEAETKSLLNVASDEPPATLEANARHLRSELAQLADQYKTYLFDQRYRDVDKATTTEALFVQEQLELPGVVARELVDIATPAELDKIRLGILPERLQTLGDWALQDVLVSRAYEGFYLDSVNSPDNFTLTLYTSGALGLWGEDIRIEIRQDSFDGELLGAFGQSNVTTHLTFVEDGYGTYRAHDGEGNALYPATDFYNSILETFLVDKRESLKISDVKSLKTYLRGNALMPYRLLELLPNMPLPHWSTFAPDFMRLRAGSPSSLGEVAQLQVIAGKYEELVNLSFHESVPVIERYNFLRGLKLLHERYPDECVLAMHYAVIKANGEGNNQPVIGSIEVLPELQSLMRPEQFDALTGRLFTEEGLVPLTESERNLGMYAQNLQQTGRANEYQALIRSVRESGVTPSPKLRDLSEYGELLFEDVATPGEPVQVSAQIMANLKMAQEAIYRAKELLPLSSNQLASMWEKGGSAIAGIKHLRGMDLGAESVFTSDLTIAQASEKAIAIKGGNCSENSKVTFSILASQPRTSAIHIVKVTGFDHQYVVIGDDLSNLNGLVVADSWPEFPAAHLASKGTFEFVTPPLETLPPGPAVGEYRFINDTPPGPATLPAVSEENTYRQIKMNKLYLKTARTYVQWTSLDKLGQTYAVEGGTPVSFERMPASVIESRLDAHTRYREAFKDLLDEETEAD